ncbi:MAG TPA: nitrogen regulation protein NR(II) [Burkholderiales bacterium]|jgi:two-component system nitrogen regulation sensor histidine kinase GlnL|nr:nitrogen regulation protein NR(II) [Burkholderiales bacterium]
MAVAALAGLDLLATAIVIVDRELVVRYANPAAENLFELSSKSLVGNTITETFEHDRVLGAAIDYARTNNCSYTEHDLKIGVPGHAKLHLSCTLSPIEIESWVAGWQGLLLEFRHIEQQIKIAREERLHDQSQANRELIRNLAHEIKNPLGGIRGAAQLLDHELERPGLHEYTQVIMKEADRLQSLMDRLLTPHRLPQPAPLNIHEVLERVRSLILAEYPRGIAISRDYDTSVPLLKGDKEQMIQIVLNIARNAAQAMKGDGHLTLKTRIARQVTLSRKRYRHALVVEITDTGPGIPEDMREKVFYPLVSGREGGSGLGLTLAQTFVTQHGGTITFESQPGNTTFTLLLPINKSEIAKS